MEDGGRGRRFMEDGVEEHKQKIKETFSQLLGRDYTFTTWITDCRIYHDVYLFPYWEAET